MRIEDGRKLDFSDVLIRPKRSTLGSRAEVDIRRTFRALHTGKEWTGFPLMASNMDTTGTFAMAKALLAFGALVALHRYYPVEHLVDFFRGDRASNAFFTLGTTEADKEKLSLVKQQASIDKI